MGQTGPKATTLDAGAAGDGAGVVAVALPVGGEGVAADSGLAVVVVKLSGVCGDWLVLCVQAVTPRAKTAGARNITMRRPRELFMIVPFPGIRESWMNPPAITFSPGSTGQKPSKVRCSPTSAFIRAEIKDDGESKAHVPECRS
jgi:hypothetical protein